jgi:hypothetical protein
MRFACLVAALALLAATGCVRVKPWEREHLAKRSLKFSTEKGENHFKGHLYETREASRGGNAEPGGGCGCN